MAGRRAVWIAWVLCAVTLLGGVGAIVLGVHNGAAAYGAAKSHLLFVGTCAVAGALVAGSRPRNALGWALLVSASSFGLLEFFGEYAIAGTGPGARLAGWPENWLWVPANLGMALVPLLFPDGLRPRAKLWWALLGPLFAVALTAAVLGALRPGPSGQVRDGAGVDNPFGVAGLVPAADAVGAAFTVLAGLAFVGGGGAVLWRARHADEVRRRQIKWVAWASAVAAVVVAARLVAGLIDADTGSVWPRASLVWEAAGAVALSLLPAAVTVAVLRHRLYDIDVLITRTLLYGALSACLLGGYALIAGYLGALLGRSTSLSVSAPAAAAVAVAFAPLRDRIQRGITILMHGRREEPYVVLARLGRRLDDAVAPAAVLPLIAETVAETLRASYVAVTVTDGPAAVGSLPGDAVPADLPLTYQGSPVGTLSIWPRPPFDEAVLADLARQVGAAVHSARLAADLQRSRERLVMAREEERRRLRRDLHDGLGPTLAALTMRAEAAQDARPDTLKTLLAKVVDDAEAAVGDVRRLVDGLRPAALDSLGLTGALAAHLAGLPAGSPAVRLSAPDELPVLPAATEVAAYRIAVEAVTNVCRHAKAAEASVRLSIVADRLVVEVGDDGRGLDGVRPGVGLTSMRERADELGGSLTVETGTAGTRIRAELPATAPEGN
ncbi:hypothetical protein Aab01nite_31540 [Paractinoplanes abujensis]|uniref:histidine kinase n=1 Tax=Paractinoplanes abujensis TaxID=882441 RepID=A0A7W7D2U5_9ACTN|nr:sensor histidine kinase [Actinoplanes abujensis]MBB4697953.1 signal transduction histidine kinase [Actinoplanes abujensis]GID19564.1 hypothetical protein Aab01nite_31540 [Actinoplanes abujensis]